HLRRPRARLPGHDLQPRPEDSRHVRRLRCTLDRRDPALLRGRTYRALDAALVLRDEEGGEGQVLMDVRGARLTMFYQARKTSVWALDELRLEVAAGEVVALIGPSGCSKSTLLKAVAGLLNPTSGRVLLGSEVVTKPRTDIGMMFQSPVLLPWKSVL